MVMITMEKYRATLSFRVMEISEVFTDRSNDNEVVTDYVDEGSEPLLLICNGKVCSFFPNRSLLLDPEIADVSASKTPTQQATSLLTSKTRTGGNQIRIVMVCDVHHDSLKFTISHRIYYC